MYKRLLMRSGITISLSLSLAFNLVASSYYVDKDSVYTVSELKHVISDSSAAKLIGKELSVGGIANIAAGLLHERYLQIFIQDDSTGISLFKYEINEPVSEGDSVVAYGRLQNYFGLIEINVDSYKVFHKTRDVLSEPIPLQTILNDPGIYEGILIHSAGVITEKGTRFNGKYLKISPSDTTSKSIMVYVTNFHALYQKFNFQHLSVGDWIDVAGVISKYDAGAKEEGVYQIVLRRPSDLGFEGLPKYYLLIAFTTISFITVFIIGWIILLKNQVRKQTSIIRTSLEEKEVLLQEIHHRVKNNLAIISGLIELQLDSTSDPEAQRVLRDSQARIKSMAMVHEKLYESSSLSDVGMENYVRELVETISQTFSKNTSEVRVEMNISSIELPIERVIPCGLLINELVVNAYKHAFKKMKEGQGLLRIGLHRKGAGIELRIADNGPGLPPDLARKENESLGMMLIHTFAAQLEANVELNTEQGTSFAFYFSG